MRYKVGDKVKIRTDLVPHTSYGRESFQSPMTGYCGREATIVYVHEHSDGNEYFINIDDGEWYWTDEMFDENYLHTPKFKIGDKVRIRKDAKVGEKYNELTLRDEMYKCHDVMIIEAIDDDTYLCKENDFWWGEDMLENVEDINKNIGMTVADLLNKTDVEKGSLIISISYPNAYCETTLGHNKINRNSELYKRFIAAYGNMIVDEVSFDAFDVEDANARVIMKIKVDYAD